MAGTDEEESPASTGGLVRMPMFPLGTVVYPGLTLPLVIFEDRYRTMMRDLLRLPEPDRRFGVVAIREGYEVAGSGRISGANDREARGRQSWYRLGCEAQLVRAEREPDGGYQIETVGTRRFRVHEVRTEGDYVTADVVPLGEPIGESAAAAAAGALRLFESYRQVISVHRGGAVMVGDLPTAPLALSYALASTVPLTLGHRQALLEIPDAADRLRRIEAMLRAELAAVRAVPSLPATDVVRTGWSPN